VSGPMLIIDDQVAVYPLLQSWSQAAFPGHEVITAPASGVPEVSHGCVKLRLVSCGVQRRVCQQRLTPARDSLHSGLVSADRRSKLRKSPLMRCWSSCILGNTDGLHLDIKDRWFAPADDPRIVSPEPDSRLSGERSILWCSLWN